MTQAGQRLILDCGTGARLLGAHMMAHAPRPIEAAILFSHTHWDHIQGFPFFAPVFVPGGRITVCGPSGAHNCLPETLSGQMEYTYFPVKLEELGAKIEYRDLNEGEHEVGGVRIRTQLLNHPAVTLGYRIEADGVSVMYVCDHEPFWETLWRSGATPGELDSILHAGDRRHAEFLRDADVVIHDAQYTPEEYPAKKNWGHSTYRYVTQICAAANVKRLYLTHHDPTHDDAFLTQLEQQARVLAHSMGSFMEVHCAREGTEESLEGAVCFIGRSENAQATAGVGQQPRRVLIADDDEDLRILAAKILRRSWDVFEARNGQEALELAETAHPDVILLDLVMPPPDGFEVLKRIRSAPKTREVPVVVLTARDDEESIHRCFELGASDYLEKPFTAPQLDVRVRSILSRALPRSPESA